MALTIVADENIPLAREALASFGDVILAPGRKIDAQLVADADALLVRSVTRIDARLLDGSRVRFVGTATIGTDHVDLGYLEERGIAFASAPGCNARSVAEYVTAALLELEVDLGRDWRGATLGVVGVGNVGSRVAVLARVLGMRVLECDPPRAERDPAFRSTPLAEVLAEAEVITCHVPLTKAGPHATRHLLSAAAIAALRPGALLLNTSRGGVIDDRALHDACVGGRASAVLDVWEAEPEPPPSLIDAVRIATPHIAGYSLDGKLAGTRMIADALRTFLGVPDESDRRMFSPPVAEPEIVVAQAGRDGVRAAVRGAYAIRADDARLRTALADPGGPRGQAFDALRRDYPVRREFGGFVVRGAALDEDARATLAGLGFGLPR